MGEPEQVEDNNRNDTTMNNSVVTFDNFRILKEFSNIANLVRTEEFLETVPKLRGVKWVQMFNCLKQDILSEMEQEISSMWEFENMPKKLEILEKQKEKYAEINPNKSVWRPQNNDIKGQLKAFDVANLRKQKSLLLSLAQENESKANRLKKTVAAKRGYLKALQMDIQKYQKKSEQIMIKIHEKIENHEKLANYMLPNIVNVNDIHLTDSEVDE
ncbi:uncharacterized protein LOC120631433 [Pararge aegeria]|uniref:Jg16795 protein n=1 Tax=Pararge aegeria aegeria TaxID=348720 RepID=A0A8S4RYM8_9NEOP|nr:uncharacterized protein LOC120631433 [Pararge aegeria]CAH2243953.1 jg16795 [Pararge aegeria aegeria]